MASLETRLGPKKGPRFRLVFRLHGQKYQQVLAATTQSEAEQIKAATERTLDLIADGRVTVPVDADIGLFVTTDGRIAKLPAKSSTLQLGTLFETYHESLPSGTLEENSLTTIKTHLKHVSQLLGEKKRLAEIRHEDLQRYVKKRLQQSNRRGHTISPVTVRKEVASLRAVWNWALLQERVKVPFPGKGLQYQKTVEKSQFRTWKEIERMVSQGGDETLWDSLFLDRDEIEQLLDYAREYARHDFVYPMLAMAAHTGARRSEILRSERSDVDFTACTIRIRERKRRRGECSTRMVPMSAQLTHALKDWFQVHPGSSSTFCCGQIPRSRTQAVRVVPISVGEAHHHFKRTFRGGKWANVRGWHVLRHSFASNCAASGVDQRMIDSWMGHTTLEMQKRYRHLFPDQERAALATVFG